MDKFDFIMQYFGNWSAMTALKSYDLNDNEINYPQLRISGLLDEPFEIILN